jgi:hypothetical protein
MLKNPTAPTPLVPTFIKGQVYKYGERCLRIEHVGKMLVEHRGVSLEQKRNITPKRMVTMKELQTFLEANEAVLMIN